MENIYMDDGQTTESERKIHTPSAFARKNLIFAQETGRLKSIRPHSCVRENLDSYLLFIVLEGRGKVETGGKEYEAKAGDVVFLDCRKHYSHTSDAAEPWVIRWVHFNGELPGKLFAVFEEANKKKPVFTPEKGLAGYEKNLDRLAEILEDNKVISEINQSKLLDKILCMILNDTVGDSVLSFDDRDKTGTEDEFSSLRESVNDHIGEPNLERILSIQYGLQPETLNSLFEQKYGISLQNYIVNRKFNKVKELLRFTIKSIDEIISEVGIEDEKALRDYFMETEEMTPEDYRRRWAQWIKS